MDQIDAILLDYIRAIKSVLVDADQVPYIENLLSKNGGPYCEVICSSSEISDKATKIVLFWYHRYIEVFMKCRYPESFPKIALLNSYLPVCKIHLKSDQTPILIISKGSIGEIFFNSKRLTDFMLARNSFFELGHYPIIQSSYSNETVIKRNFETFFQHIPQASHEFFCYSVAWSSFLIRIFHEIDHWLSGHLFFKIQYKKDISKLNSDERLSLLRTLEYDADSFIASESINFILNSPLVPNFAIGVRQTSKPTQIEFLQRCFIASFQHPTVSDNVPQDGSGSHDPFRWRAFSLIKTLPEAYRIRSDFEGYELSVQQSAEAYRLMYDLAGLPLPQDVHFQADVDAYNVSIGKTMSIWSAIRPYLVPLKKGSGNLAKAQAVPDPKFVGWIAE